MRSATLNEELGQWEAVIPVKEYYTVQDVMGILGVGGPSVYGAIKRGTMAGVYVNDVKHVRHTALLTYMSRRSSAPVFDPDNLIIRDIIPDKEAAKEAASMVSDDREFDADFLGE